MLNVSRLIKGSIVALAVVAVVAGGATAMTVVSNARARYKATLELANGAPQSIADRFRTEFAEWPRRPRRHRGHAIH